MDDDKLDSEPWYAAKLIFGWYFGGSSSAKRYEERIVLFRASSPEHAISQAEDEAEEYSRSAAKGLEIHYEGFMDVYHLFDSAIGHRTELYSKLRESPLSAEMYLDRYYDEPEDSSS